MHKFHIIPQHLIKTAKKHSKFHSLSINTPFTFTGPHLFIGPRPIKTIKTISMRHISTLLRNLSLITTILPTSTRLIYHNQAVSPQVYQFQTTLSSLSRAFFSTESPTIALPFSFFRCFTVFQSPNRYLFSKPHQYVKKHKTHQLHPYAATSTSHTLQAWSLFGWLGSSELSDVTVTPEQRAELEARFPRASRLTKPKDMNFFPPEIVFVKPLPPVPERDRSIKDKYGFSINNVYRYCHDNRLHEKFQVSYQPDDIHHNINEYQTFIEKERFYIRRDNLELANIRHVFVKRLLQLHHLLGVPLEGQERYEKLLQNKIRERLIAQKRLLLFDRQAKGEVIPYEEFDQITVSDDEVHADPDSMFFKEILLSDELPIEILPPHLAQLVMQQKEQDKLNHDQNGMNISNDDEINVDIIASPSPQPIELFPKLTPGNIQLLPPEIREYLDQVRLCVSYSLTSVEELGQALNTLHQTLYQFDQMVFTSEQVEDYHKQQNLLACQAAFITGLRQVIYNVLKHSNDVLYKYEDFFTPSTTRYLASLVYHPENHQSIHEITPFHPNYYDEFTPPEVADKLKQKEELRNAKRNQKYIQKTSNKLLNMAKGSLFGSTNSNNLNDNPDNDDNDDYDDENLAIQFPQPPALAIDKLRMNEAVQAFAGDLTDTYAPISYPYREIIHRWHPADALEVKKFEKDQQLSFRAIPPPAGYRPRPAELPFMSGIESNIPEKFKDAPGYGWIKKSPSSSSSSLSHLFSPSSEVPPHFDVDYDDIIYSELDQFDDTDVPLQFTPLSRDSPIKH